VLFPNGLLSTNATISVVVAFTPELAQLSPLPTTVALDALPWMTSRHATPTLALWTVSMTGDLGLRALFLAALDPNLAPKPI
jgi:hypothetical protein